MHPLSTLQYCGATIILFELFSLFVWQWRLRVTNLIIVWGLGIALCGMSCTFDYYPHDGLLVMGVPFYVGFFERQTNGQWFDFPADNGIKFMTNGLFWLLAPQFVWCTFANLSSTLSFFRKETPLTLDREGTSKVTGVTTSSPPSKKIPWLLHYLVGTALIGACLTGVFYWSNSSAPYLHYEVSETALFEGTPKKSAIMTVRITNDGSLTAEDVSCFLDLEKGAFIDATVIPEHLKPRIENKGNRVTVKIDYLHPGSWFQVSLMATGFERLPERPPFTIQAKGVTGNSHKSSNLWGILAIGFAVLGIIAFIDAAVEEQTQQKTKASFSRLKQLEEHCLKSKEQNSTT